MTITIELNDNLEPTTFMHGPDSDYVPKKGDVVVSKEYCETYATYIVPRGWDCTLAYHLKNFENHYWVIKCAPQLKRIPCNFANIVAVEGEEPVEGEDFMCVHRVGPFTFYGSYDATINATVSNTLRASTARFITRGMEAEE